MSAGYAHDQRRRTAHEAMQARKLFLVLDLDHTLLNSCKVRHARGDVEGRISLVTDWLELGRAYSPSLIWLARVGVDVEVSLTAPLVA